MSTNKLGQAISNQPDINLPTQAGLIVNTQFSQPVYVYGAHIVIVQKKDRPRKSGQCMKGSITIKQVQSAIDSFYSPFKEGTVYVQRRIRVLSNCLKADLVL